MQVNKKKSAAGKAGHDISTLEFKTKTNRKLKENFEGLLIVTYHL
jgi:hypothetical protein